MFVYCFCTYSGLEIELVVFAAYVDDGNYNEPVATLVVDIMRSSSSHYISITLSDVVDLLMPVSFLLHSLLRFLE